MISQSETHDIRTTSIGWMFQRVTERLNRSLAQKLMEHDLTVQHFVVMMTVLEHAGLTQAQIGQHLELPAYVVTRAIDHLETTGFLERNPHPTSRRAHIIQATDTGQTLRHSLYSIVRSTNDDLMAPLTADQRAEFEILLAKLL